LIRINNKPVYKRACSDEHRKGIKACPTKSFRRACPTSSFPPELLVGLAGGGDLVCNVVYRLHEQEDEWKNPDHSVRGGLFNLVKIYNDMNIPFSLPFIDAGGFAEMNDTLISKGWLTSGPKVLALEKEFKKLTNAEVC
jgi:hypothetical protein